MMKKLTNFVLLIALCCFCTHHAQAQTKKTYFNAITTESGLPDSYITSYTQDRYGYLWFGTPKGLVRFDGIQLKPYTFKDKDGNPVDACMVMSVYEDSHGKLWALVNKVGIYAYDVRKDAFEKVTVKNENKLIKEQYVWKSWVENNNQFWILGGRSNTVDLFLFDPQKQSIESFGASDTGKYFLPNHFGGDVLKDRTGNIWATSDSLLSLYDNQSKTFKPYFVLTGFSKNTGFATITHDPIDPDIIWMTTSIFKDALTFPFFENLVRFNIKTKTLKKYSHSKNVKGSISSDTCLLVKVDSLNRLWVVTQKGASLYNRGSDSFTNYPFNPNDGDAFYVFELASDKDGNIWRGYF